MSTAWATPLTPGQLLPPPRSGVELGPTKSGQLTLRLFRERGTRVAVMGAADVAQLLVLRAALAGASVRVATDNTAAWAGVVRHGGDSRFIPSLAAVQAPVGVPTVIVDDLGLGAPVGDVQRWHCHLRIARLDRARVDLARLAGLAHVEVALFDAVSETMAAEVGRLLDLGEDAATLTVVPPRAVAVVTRGNVHLVRPELTGGERSALGA